MSISNKIAEFVISTSFEDLPEEAIINAKRAFLDSLGVMIAGSKTETVDTFLNFIEINKLTGASNVRIGDIDASLSILDAASLYGIMLHALDYDDTGAFSQGHPSSTIFPIIYILLKEYEVSGKDIIVAYTLGVEILSRLSRTMPMLHLKGWHPTGIIGTIAATITASKLLKLNQEQIVNSIGIACSSASGLVQNFGSMTKPLHAGNAVSNGLKAVLLAKEGFTSSADAIDGELGFIQTYFHDLTKKDDFLNKFSTDFVIVNPGINIKRHASCSLTHRSIDGVLKIVKSNKLRSDEIKTIKCYSSPRAQKVLFYTNPKTELEAKFSMQYVLAVAVVYGDLSPKQFSQDIIKNEIVKKIMDSVKFRVHEDWVDGNDWRADKVIIETHDGRIYEELVQFPKGNVALPLSWEEIVQKFKNCCNGIIDENSMLEHIDWVTNLEVQTISI